MTYNNAIKNRHKKRGLDSLTLAFYCGVIYKRYLLLKEFNELFWKELIGKVLYIQWAEDHLEDDNFKLVDIDPYSEWLKLIPSDSKAETIFVPLSSIAFIKLMS